jgi:hypothetical protein
MKKLLLAGLLFMGFESAQGQVAVGLKAGLNSANITGTMDAGPNNGGGPSTGGGLIWAGRSRMFAWLNNYDREYKLGFHAGVFANIQVAQGLALQPELLYSTKGFVVDQKTSTNNQTTKTEVNSRMKYLDLPLLVQLQTGAFYLEAGPQASLLLNQHTRGYSVTTQAGPSGKASQISGWSNTHKGREGYKTVDLGYGLGLGINFPNNIFSCGLRYSNSLSTILKDAKTDARTSLLQLALTAKLASFGG